MWWSFILNVFMGLVMLITMLFCIGDLETAIGSSAPYLILFKNTGSNAWSYTLMIILFFLVFLNKESHSLRVFSLFLTLSSLTHLSPFLPDKITQPSLTHFVLLSRGFTLEKSKLPSCRRERE